jgi:cell fate (sporulation/competence/biofilm development) regulator YlbF (YheA/YmcA/DUF963 family)
LLATIERVILLEEAEELEAAEEYRHRLNKLRTDKETQRKIQAFVKLKESYEEVQRFGKYHPDYKKVMGEIREAKRVMDLDENVFLFKKAENELQSLLDEIAVIIGHSVSEHIKVPTGNPFFDSLSGCSGGCGIGGSCSCSA